MLLRCRQLFSDQSERIVLCCQSFSEDVHCAATTSATSLKEDWSPSSSCDQKSLWLICEFKTIWSWSWSWYWSWSWSLSWYSSSSYYQNSLRLRCEFKTVWWRQSTRRRSCGREWKCLQIGPNWDERQNWDILILSISRYKNIFTWKTLRYFWKFSFRLVDNFGKNCFNWNLVPADKCSRSRQFSDKEVVSKVVHVTSPGLVRDLPMFPPPWPH